MPFEQIPYTNFHGTNQDWMIQQIKQMIADWASYRENLDAAWAAYQENLTGEWTDYQENINSWRQALDAAFTELHTYVHDYFDNLDVQEEINNKLDEFLADGTLDAILLPYFNTYTEQINDSISIQNNKISTLETQVNNFLDNTGTLGTEKDPELIDIRVGADNTVYPTAGGSVRGQINKIQYQNNEIFSLLDTDIIEESYNITNQYYGQDNVLHTSQNWRAYFFDPSNIELFTVISSYAASVLDYYQIAFFNSNTDFNAQTFVSGSTFSVQYSMNTVKTIVIPDGAITAIICTNVNMPTNSTVIIRGIKKSDDNMYTILKNTEDTLSAVTSHETITSIDPLNDITFTSGGYINKNGSVQANSSYKYTNKITVNPGDIITNDTNYIRFVCAYNNDTVVSSAGTDNAVTSYTVPDGVNGIIVSVLATGQPASNNLTRSYTENIVTVNGEKEANISFSHCGNNSIIAETATLQANDQLMIDQFPKYLKKGVSLSFYGTMSEFTSLKIGKGYNQYRGSWLEIDNTNIISKYCTDDSGTVVTKKTTAHQLTISDFIAITITVLSDNDSDVQVAINTMSGSKTFVFDWSHEFNGEPFVISGQLTGNVKFTATANDAKSPVWLFGDSYYGVASNRIIGQLINIGYASAALIDARAGNNSSHAYNDLMMLLNMGAKPKYLVWNIGMNGTAYSNIEKANALKAMQEKYGFTVILGLVPTVPSRAAENNETNQGYLNTGLRIINNKKAVGASDTGTWYEDYLSSDGIHPTVLGAQALAMRICIDFPEIMQYGFEQGQIGDSISGDN